MAGTEGIGAELIQNGYAYYCVVKDSAGNTLTSDIVRYDGSNTLTTISTSSVGSVTASAPTLSGGKISVETSGGIAPYTYEWHKLGQSGVYGTTSSVEAEDGEAYYCIVKDSAFKYHSSTSYTTAKSIVGSTYTMTITAGSLGDSDYISSTYQDTIKEYYQDITGKEMATKTVPGKNGAAPTLYLIGSGLTQKQYNELAQCIIDLGIASSKIKFTNVQQITGTVSDYNCYSVLVRRKYDDSLVNSSSNSAAKTALAEALGLTDEEAKAMYNELPVPTTNNFGNVLVLPKRIIRFIPIDQADQIEEKLKEYFDVTIYNEVSCDNSTPLRFTAQPDGYTGGSGNTSATMSVAVTGGSGSYTYQWYYIDKENTAVIIPFGVTGTAIDGATSSSYTANLNSTTQDRLYCCVVTDSVGNKATSSYTKLYATATNYATLRIDTDYGTNGTSYYYDTSKSMLYLSTFFTGGSGYGYNNSDISKYEIHWFRASSSDLSDIEEVNDSSITKTSGVTSLPLKYYSMYSKLAIPFSELSDKNYYVCYIKDQTTLYSIKAEFNMQTTAEYLINNYVTD